MTAQLILPIGVDDAPGLDNYIDSANRRQVALLKQQLLKYARAEQDEFAGVFLWGEPGSGKTHLLSAMTQWVEQQGGKVMRPGVDDLGLHTRLRNHRQGIYLLDDVEMLISDGPAERNFLTMIERLKQVNALLIMTAGHSVKTLGIGLPDLSSRLQAMDGFELKSLSDKDKRRVLLQRANTRGIELSEEVLNWLFTHTSRDMGRLLDLLERIDVRSLSQQRKVTIPLIKAILED